MAHHEPVPPRPRHGEHAHRQPSTDVGLTEQISSLHAETIAAVEQQQTLAVEARRLLIAALHEGVICRPGCEDALTAWGLEPLPQRWTVSAAGHLSYTREHTDHDEARQQACFGVPAELGLLRFPMAAYPRQVIDVTPVPKESDGRPGTGRFRITVAVAVWTWVTATRATDAINAARTAVESELPGLAAVGINLTGLTWQGAEGSDDIPLDEPDTDPRPAVASVVPPADVDDPAAATTARDAAVRALADLRHRIRTRAIRALADDELCGDYQRIAVRVDQFLVDLGLDALPWAHHVTVVVDLTLPAGEGTAVDACDTARNTMRAATVGYPDETRPWTADGWPRPEHATIDQDGWRMPWRHEYEMWLRDQATPADATAAAEAVVRADLTRVLANVDHLLPTVTVHVEGVGVDRYLDPDRD
ncbi:hypothetical protein [Micromonospora echinofusca]|uniref:Uncharacterized protein n=1 Tax=Micromonospora echinofusca TaxID=47858 RepID=A0ABS3VZ20_MICEH|nr:hypothetical protein [Micromonospora echinofusca]MBO4209796.1 hypothetical protein [Micromonospora echinofusca]